ncbi:MAG TPA: pyruvate formate-lyase-activating protein [Clostridia bacterium]
MKKGYVHSIESLGTVDGPGVRTVVFMQGCYLRCRYCHNPDTWECSGGKSYTAQELFNFVIKFRPYFGKSGGITVSGGEPLLQPEFLYEFFELLKQNNIHTAIDTSGLLNDEIKKLLTKTDLVLLDIKHTDPIEYKKLTGGDLSAPQKMHSYLIENNIPFWIRQVIVPGINDTVEQIKELAKYCVHSQKYELIAYHTLGLNKWRFLNIPYSLEGVEPPSKELMTSLKAALDEEVNHLRVKL